MIGKVIFGLLMLCSAGLSAAFLLGTLQSTRRGDLSGAFVSLLLALVLILGAVYFYKGFQGQFDEMIRRFPGPSL